MSARRLSAREIDHVAEQAADRRPQHVQDAEGASHGRQNQRSEMMTVSARPHRECRRHFLAHGRAVDRPADLDLELERARRIAAGDRDRGSRTVMLATYGYCPGSVTSPRMKNGPIGLDLDRDVRLADVALP